GQRRVVDRDQRAHCIERQRAGLLPAPVVQIDVVVRLDVETLDLVAADVAFGRGHEARAGTREDGTQDVAMYERAVRVRGALCRVDRGAVAVGQDRLDRRRGDEAADL